jgi:hypothetical protein
MIRTLKARVCALGLVLLVLGGLVMLQRLGDGGARGEPIRIAFAGPMSGSSADDGVSAMRAA